MSSQQEALTRVLTFKTRVLTKSLLTTAQVRYIPCACLKFHYTLGLGRSITVNTSYMALTYLQHACIIIDAAAASKCGGVVALFVPKSSSHEEDSPAIPAVE